MPTDPNRQKDNKTRPPKRALEVAAHLSGNATRKTELCPLEVSSFENEEVSRPNKKSREELP
jgi:hypothetical protein